MMPVVTVDDIRGAVSANAFEAGRAYEAGGHVSDLRLLSGGRVIEAKVQGSARRPYRVRVMLGLRVRDGATIVSGSCSCPVGYNCKHVAATLFAAVQRESASPPAAHEPNPRTEAEPPLSSAVTAWLLDLERARQDETEEYPPAVRKRLLYVADVPRAPGGIARLDVNLVGVETRHGLFVPGTARHYAPYQFSASHPARFLRPSDRAIIHKLTSLGYDLASGGAMSVAALREMRRVCTPGGIVAARDADYAAMTWYPPQAALDRWLDLYRRVARTNRAEPDAGRRLLSWATAAGFSEITSSAAVWCYATPEERAWWGGLWAQRVTASALAGQAVDRNLATRDDLEDIADGWRQWAAQNDGWFALLHGEVLCRP